MVRRLRKQIIINYRSSEQPYYIAIRVLTFNPDVTRKMLLSVAMDKRKVIQKSFGTTLRKMKVEVGDESREVDVSEDRGLNNTSIYVQVQVKKQIIDFQEIKLK